MPRPRSLILRLAPAVAMTVAGIALLVAGALPGLAWALIVWGLALAAVGCRAGGCSPNPIARTPGSGNMDGRCRR